MRTLTAHEFRDAPPGRSVSRPATLGYPGVFLISIGIANLTPNAYLAPWSLLAIPVITMLLDRRVRDKDAQPMPKESRGTTLFWGLAPLILLCIFAAAGLLAFTTAQH